jgi:hypothetical protein
MSKMDKNYFYNLFFSAFPAPVPLDCKYGILYKAQLFHIIVFDHIVDAFSAITVFKVF